MDADSELGILQVPPTPINRLSFFARLQQFAARVYGPVVHPRLRHLGALDGNYWGHNAIIRIEAFMKHCGLPVLPGKAPLGGEILSHDFVEAALMRRAGYKVCLADDLDGSYEEVPDQADRLRDPRSAVVPGEHAAHPAGVQRRLPADQPVPPGVRRVVIPGEPAVAVVHGAGRTGDGRRPA